MNLSTNTKQSMSTREIAQITGKEHKNVKRDCEVMFKELELDALRFELIYLDTQNRKQSEYALDESLTMTLVTGYSIKLRNAVIERWKQLEKEQHYIPQTYGDALQLCADQAKQLEAQAPKVNFYDNLADKKNLMTASQVGQKIRISAIQLNKILNELQVYNGTVKRSKVFQQWFIDKSLGEMKQTELGYSQALFTTKGEQWVFEKLTSEGLI